MISKRAMGISPSQTLAITAKVNALRKEGVDVIGFGAGEPDFDTPVHIKAAAIKAIEEGFTKYTPTSGIQELKEAVAEKFKRENGLNYKPSQVIVSCGAKHTIYNILMALCDPGDEVIIPLPYWVSYPEQVRMADAEPVYAETHERDGFALTAASIEAKLSKRTKAVIVNSPCNPTGAVCSEDELREIACLAEGHNFYIISDEIYEHLIYEGKHVSIASLGAYDRTITVNGTSKAYSMTGWRIGYAAGPEDVIKAMSSIQDHSTSNPTSISQRAAVAALKSPESPGAIRKMVEEFGRRRNAIFERLKAIPGVSTVKPKGAFYIFPNVSGLFGRAWNRREIKCASDLADYLLSEAHVAVVPGEGFGTNAHIRLSYATSMENIVKGLDRIAEAVSKLK
ncbi:MAG: pyridoxal phosphate-dependent aminotransferase [bacterium]